MSKFLDESLLWTSADATDAPGSVHEALQAAAVAAVAALQPTPTTAAAIELARRAVKYSPHRLLAGDWECGTEHHPARILDAEREAGVHRPSSLEISAPIPATLGTAERGALVRLPEGLNWCVQIDRDFPRDKVAGRTARLIGWDPHPEAPDEAGDVVIEIAAVHTWIAGSWGWGGEPGATCWKVGTRLVELPADTPVEVLPVTGAPEDLVEATWRPEPEPEPVPEPAPASEIEPVPEQVPEPECTVGPKPVDVSCLFDKFNRRKK